MSQGMERELLENAVRMANLDEVKRLLATDIDVNAFGKYDDFLIMQLSVFTPQEIINGHRMDCDSAQSYDYTQDDEEYPTWHTYYAQKTKIQQDKAEILRELIKAGAVNTIKDSIDNTPFMYLCGGGCLHLVKILLENNMVTPEEKDWGLQRAAENGDYNLVNVLLEAGASPHGKLHYVSGCHLAENDIWNYIRIVGRNFDKIPEKLMEYGADINEKSADGKTPLMYAIGTDTLLIGYELVKLGAPIDERDMSGRTLLLRNVFYGNVKMALDLIERGADVNVMDNKGNTPLSVAKQFRRNVLIDALIEKGAK